MAVACDVRAYPPAPYDQRPRGVAQLGSALALGARGRGFESRHPDAALGAPCAAAVLDPIRPPDPVTEETTQ